MFLEDVPPIPAITKVEYEQAASELRVDLLTLQHKLLGSKAFPVIVKLAGFDRFGRHACMDVLHQWIDPRHLTASAYAPQATEEQRLRPWLWRFWQKLPPRGDIGLFARAWTESIIGDRLRGVLNKKRFERRIEFVQNLERMFVADGALILKVWLHISRKELKQRLREGKKDRLQAWRIKPEDHTIAKNYDKCRAVAEQVLEATHCEAAPWHVIDSTHARARNLAFGRLLRSELQKHLVGARPAVAPSLAIETTEPAIDYLAEVDLTSMLPYGEYTRKCKRLQARLARLTREAHQLGIATVLAFEGWDAAGKGGVIRRLTKAIDASMFRVVPIAAPSEEEKRYNHLWRFWRHLPRDGNVAIFDRTWYGRVLVERLEGFASEVDWRRAYAEINDFENQLAAHKVVVLKFWVHIDKDEQLRRFKEREKIEFKQYKITDEDYRNRERWGEYETAVNDLVARTDTKHAPWHLIPANDKRFARVRVLEIVTKRLARAIRAAK